MMADEMTTESSEAAESAELAPKKPARRTKKATAAASADSSDSAEEKPKKPKTTRSRKKAATEEGTTEEKASSSESAEAKPKRAPRAKAKAASAASGEAVASDEGQEPKKKPARKAAKAKAADEGVIAEDGKNAATAEASQEKPVSSDASKTRKRPGRSTKLRAAVEASAASGEEGSGEAPSQEGASGRRSARSRKSEQADAKSAGSEEAESAGDLNAQRYQKRNRDGRGSERQNRTERNRDGRGGQKGGQRDNRSNGRSDKNDRHNRRDRNSRRDQFAPKTNIDELSQLKIAELRAKAAEFEIDVEGLKKFELVDKVYAASVRAEGFVEVEGILDIMQDGYGFLRTKGYLPSENDVYIATSLIRRNNMRKGDMVRGQTRPARENEKYAALQTVISVNGIAVEEMGSRVKFGDLTPVFPDEPLIMEHGRTTITARVIDLVSPIGKGQRGLIVSPPKAGKTTVLKDIAAAITANNPNVHLMCLLVDERPEEVTDMQRSIAGEVIASTFDMPTEDHIQVSELVIERAKRLVEMGADVVILLDSLTRLARAYNLATPASGRILSGGVDSTALYPPKRFLGAARNIEGGGSLTILASALIETGSKMDEVIFEEFKGTGNMELKLDRSLADRRVFPAIDPISSGTRREDLLLDPQEAPLIWAVRRILANMNNTERSMDMLIKSLKQTENNEEFLMRAAKKAKDSVGSRDVSLM